MKQKRRSVDQIFAKLHRADLEPDKRTPEAEICKQSEIAEPSNYRGD